MIEICVVVYNFQRRWMWQLSSLLQQINPIDFTVNVAYLENNGNPKTEEVIDFFKRQGLKITGVPFTDVKSFTKSRGLLRNYQIERSINPWLLFADCDIVYSPDFINKLSLYLDSTFSGIITSPNISLTDVPLTEDFVYTDIPMLIDNVYNKADLIPKVKEYTAHGKYVPGGMMVIQKESIYKYSDGTYIGKHHCDEKLGYVGTHSDTRFRRKISQNSGQSPMIIQLPVQIHLNHYRNKNSDSDNSINLNYDKNYQR